MSYGIVCDECRKQIASETARIEMKYAQLAFVSSLNGYERYLGTVALHYHTDCAIQHALITKEQLESIVGQGITL